MSTTRLLRNLDQSEQDVKANPINVSSKEWDTMPSNIRRITGTYLLQERVLPEKEQTEKALLSMIVNRRNMDLPYPDRNSEQACYAGFWCKMVDYLCRSGGPDELSACLVCISLVLSIPIGLVGSSVGVFVDGGCAIKRSCDEARDEKLHRDIVGPPVRQTM